MDRRAWFWGGLAASVAVTALLWWLGVPGFFFALFVPFFLFPAARRQAPQCKACGAEAQAADRFCSRCGAAIGDPGHR